MICSDVGQCAQLLLQILLIGVSNGAVIALIALGYTLVYGIIEFINFAHGDLFMLGTMFALTLVQTLVLRRTTPGPELAIALVAILVLSMVFCATVNIAIERLAYRPLRSAPRLAPLISAIGMSFILINIGQHWKGASPVDFPNLLPNIDIVSDVLGLESSVSYTTKDLFVLAVAVPLMIALRLFVGGTRLGKAMRATAQDREAAALMGIDINLTIALTFLIGGALAGSAGFIFGLYNNTAWFLQGFRGGLMAFTAAVMGGIGNLTGAFLGGMLIGILSAFSDFFFDPRWTQPVVFALLILTLVFRPAGILGQVVREKV
ncbi:MAG TPA: branched-chain amino acid ABC transporter permease [Chloroflexota bacterium]|jgi:branched-chain amino acid transport system permease protein